MAASSPPDVLMEERQEELMIPLTGGNPALRTAHFLNPTLHSLPSPPPFSNFVAISDSKKNNLKYLFNSHRPPTDKWKNWVDRLQPMYQHIWNQAGISHSILSSTQKIPKDSILIMGLAERWCVESNTFIFSWGEATLTLEDLAVLGGYSVLGDSVLCPLESVEAIGIRSIFDACRTEITENGTRCVSHQAWMDYFMDTGNKFEHQAFLVYWLSRFVLTKNNDYIARNLFSVAIHLSNGTPIALAPAVLASIYRDLRLLKRLIVKLSRLGDNDCTDEVYTALLSSPFQLILLWAWKRFCGEPRLGSRKGARKWDVVSVREALDLAEECFLWRPYALDLSISMFSKLYKENGEWVLVESNIGKELESYAKCLRVSELVGLDCIEQYLPNRVAMQFGFDQDIPSYVTRSNGSYFDAWSNYNRPIIDVKLYVPPRLFEADVTLRYLKWYKGSTAIDDSFKGVDVTRKNRTANHRTVPWGGQGDAPFLIPHVSLATCGREEGGVCIDDDKMSIEEVVHCTRKSSTSAEAMCVDAERVKKPQFQRASSSVARDAPFLIPHVSLATCGREEGGVCIDDDKMSIEEVVHCTRKSSTSAEAMCVDAERVKKPQFQRASSSVASDGDCQQVNLLMESINMSTGSVGRPKNRTEEADHRVKMDTLVVTISDEDKGSWDGTTFKLPETEQDVRVRRLERLVATLKAAKREGRLRKVS